MSGKVITHPRSNLPGFALIGYSFATLWLAIYAIEHRPRAPAELVAPDFSAMDSTEARRQAFFAFLRPAVEAENQRLRRQRRQLVDIREFLETNGELTERQRRTLLAFCETYEVTPDPERPREIITRLLRRVDRIPASMALAQAAIESGWGTSRFARKGNNYFGQWCYSKGCGIVPAKRAQGARHEVQWFDSVRQAVAAYFHNINTHSAYTELRHQRARMRQSGEALTGTALAPGLRRYSSQGQNYVDKLKSVIRSNELEAQTTAMAQDTSSRPPGDE